MSAFAKLTRYSLGVGGGTLLLSLASMRPWQEAVALSAGLVAVGWVLWGAIALADEFKTAGLFAAEVAGGALAAVVMSRQPESAGEAESEPPEAEPVESVTPARWVRVHDRRGVHMLRLHPDETPFRRRVFAFVILGERLGSFKFRDMRGRRLSCGERVDYDLWRKYTDCLAASGLFLKDKSQGARPIGGVQAVLRRLAGDCRLAGEPVHGELVTDPREGWRG
jgi:hypothetical protein